MQIYLARNQVQAGPYTLEQLNNMLATQQVALNDLMWHEGLSEWQRVGTLTHERYYYNPTGIDGASANDSDVTVSRLYGQQDATQNSTTNSESKRTSFGANRDYVQPQLTKPKPSTKVSNSVRLNKTAQTTDNVLASIPRRVLAVVINFILFSLCIVPISSSLDPDQTYELLQQGSQLQYSDLWSLVTQSVPQHLMILSLIMMLGLFFVQAVLLVKKGQSIGKLITGVRILDLQSGAIPTANVVLLRTVLTSIIYYITPIGLLAMIADLVTMTIDKQNCSLHDKLAKTYVVEAKAEQLDSNQPDTKRLNKK